MDKQLWIFQTLRYIRPVPAATFGSARGRKRARAPAALGTVAPGYPSDFARTRAIGS
jgi:hypothetical protein